MVGPAIMPLDWLLQTSSNGMMLFDGGGANTPHSYSYTPGTAGVVVCNRVFNSNASTLNLVTRTGKYPRINYFMGNAANWAGRLREVQVVRDGLSQQRAQFFGATGLTDELDPRAGTVSRQAALLDDTAQDSARLIRSDGLQGKGQLLFAPFGFPATGFQGCDPWFGEFVDRQPERVVQGGIHGLLKHAQSQFGGSGSRDLGQSTKGLQSNPRVGVLDQLRKGFQPLSRVAGGVSLGSDRDKQQRTGEDESAEHNGTIEREGLRLQVSDHQKMRSSMNPE
jgi:hypothetical protein